MGPFAGCPVPARRRNKQTLGNPGASLGRARLERTRSPARLWHADSNGGRTRGMVPRASESLVDQAPMVIRSVPNHIHQQQSCRRWSTLPADVSVLPRPQKQRSKQRQVNRPIPRQKRSPFRLERSSSLSALTVMYSSIFRRMVPGGRTASMPRYVLLLGWIEVAAQIGT